MRRTARSVSVGVISTVAIALIAVACTPGGPPLSGFTVSPKSVTVHKQEDWDAGDEPYVIQLGFRSKLGVPGSSSTSFSSQCYNGKLPANDAVPAGTTYDFPAGAADINLGDVQLLDLGDLALNTAPFEIIGTLTFVMERDGVLGGCAVSDLLNTALRGTLRDALEMLIARSATPPTTEDLINLIVGHIGEFLQSAASLIGAVIEGLGNPDDIIGIAAQIYLPTSGALTDLIQTGLSIGGLFAPGLDQGFIPIPGLPDTLAIKVGSLQRSSSYFRFKTDAFDYSFVNQVR